MDLDTPGAREIPRRWVRALWDTTEGYDGDNKINTWFPVKCPVCPDEEKTHIVEHLIRFTGLCQHHVLPIRGSAWVGYLAEAKLIGISKLTRIVRLHSKRFTSQERLCHQIADELAKDGSPMGSSYLSKPRTSAHKLEGSVKSARAPDHWLPAARTAQIPTWVKEFLFLIGRHSTIFPAA